MSKLFKTIIIFTIGIIIMSNCSYVLAAVNMNTVSNTTTNGNSTTLSSTVTTSDFDLELTNILSICLIVIGVLLILLGIAILLKLRR